MKYIRNSLFRIIVVILPFAAAAQPGIHLTTGSNMVITGSLKLVLNNAALIDDGNFTAGKSTVSFTGNAPASTARIAGTKATAFFKLTAAKSFNDLFLDNNISVGDTLTMNGGNLQLNNHALDLGSTGTIAGENNQHYITGTTGGSISATRAVFAGIPLNPGNIGLEILASGIAGNTVGAFVVERKHVTETLNGNGVQSIQRSFTITGKPKATTLNLRLRFFYQDADLFGADENSMIFWTPSDIGSQFIPVGKDSNNTVSNWVTKNGITKLGHYVLANPDKGGPPSLGAEPKKAYDSPLVQTDLADDAPATTIKAYPNPTHDQFTIELFSKEAREVLIGLYDQSGRLLQQREIYCAAGRNSIRWDLGKFTAGTYYLSAKGLGVKNIKIVKIR